MSSDDNEPPRLSREERGQRIAFWSTIFAAVAAVGALLSAAFTYGGFREQSKSNALETRPVLQLSCHNQFRDLEANMPHDTYLLSPEGPTIPLDLTSRVPTYDADGHLLEAPGLYAHCALSNFGRLPVVNLSFNVGTKFWSGQPFTSATTTATQTINVSGLAADGTYDFVLANNSTLFMRLEFPRTITLVRVDTEKRQTAPLLVDDSTQSIEASPYGGAAKPLVLPAALAPNKKAITRRR